MPMFYFSSDLIHDKCREFYDTHKFIYNFIDINSFSSHNAIDINLLSDILKYCKNLPLNVKSTSIFLKDERDRDKFDSMVYEEVESICQINGITNALNETIKMYEKKIIDVNLLIEVLQQKASSNIKRLEKNQEAVKRLEKLKASKEIERQKMINKKENELQSITIIKEECL